MPSLYDTFKTIYTAEDPKTVLETLECLLKATKEVEFIAAPKYYIHKVDITTNEITYMYHTSTAVFSVYVVNTNSNAIQNLNELMLELSTTVPTMACGSIWSSGNIAGVVTGVKLGSGEILVLTDFLPVSSSDINTFKDNVQEVK